MIRGVPDRGAMLAQLATGTRDEGRGLRNAVEEGGAVPPAALSPQPSSFVPRPPNSHRSPLLPDFCALALGYLWADLLTRRTHFYSVLDESRLRTEAVAAAVAVTQGDDETARAKLRDAAEVLRESRERFYPTGAKLFDLMLVLPRLAAPLADRVKRAADVPLNLLACAADWEAIAAEHPDLAADLRAGVGAGTVDLIGGEYAEIPSACRDLGALLWSTRRGRAAMERLFGTTAKTWARRTFGLTPLIPQVLQRGGVPSALHATFDGGRIGDDARGRCRWAGAAGEVDAAARPPLRAGAASSYLSLPETLGAAFEAEQAVGLTLARWPGVPTPFLDDLVRLHALSPVFGTFATYAEFFAEEDHFAGLLAADPRVLLSARPAPDATVDDFAAPVRDRRTFESALIAGALADLLAGRPVREHTALEDALERVVGQAVPDAGAGPAVRSESRQAQPDLHSFTRTAAADLAAALSRGGGGEPGVYVLNTLPVARVVGLTVGEQRDGITVPKPPADHPAVRQVQGGSRAAFTLELPPGGFVWLPRKAKVAKPTKRPAATAEPGVVRNEFFEVYLSEETGGVRFAKTYGRAPKRIGQQLAVRFAAPRTRRRGGEAEPTRHSLMRRRDWAVSSDGPAFGEVTAAGDLLDPHGGDVLATFRQTVRMWRGRRTAELTCEVTPSLAWGAGTAPAAEFLGVRWAWDAETATLSRSLNGTRQAAGPDRFEAPHFFELATPAGGGDLRTAVLTGGACHHRRDGRRFCETPLLTPTQLAGGQPCTWRFGLTLDDPHPMRAADDFLTPPLLAEGHGPPRSGPTGWLLAVDSPGVRVLKVWEASGGGAAVGGDEGRGTRVEEDGPGPADAHPAEPASSTLAPRPSSPASRRVTLVRLQETDGRTRRVGLRFFRTPASAHRRDLTGAQVAELPVEGDAVRVELAGYEFADVALAW